MCQALCWTWGFETVKEVGLALGENRWKPMVTLCQDTFRDRSTCTSLLGREGTEVIIILMSLGR